MKLAIHALEESRPDAAAIERFLATHDFPIVEGNSVTFVYRGEADAVYLQHFIYGLETAQPFGRLASASDAAAENGTAGDGSAGDGTADDGGKAAGDFFYLVLELPPDSTVQYKLDVVRGDHHEWILDPLNPRRARDPFGANSLCSNASRGRPGWTRFDPEARPGDLVPMEIESAAFGERRGFQLYLPARFRRSRQYPLLIVHDGSDYLRYSDLKIVLDNLIHRLETAPMIVALTDARERLEEYPDHPSHSRHLTEELVPHLESLYPLRRGPGSRGLMGASFGALAALSCAWRHPGVYGRLLLQSGSFAFTDIGHHRRGPAFDPAVRFINAFRAAPGRPSERVFMSCGTYESLIYENRSMLPLLRDTGMDVRYVEARDGHNWINWRDRLRDGLSWLFPGPLWMVYE